MSVTEVPARLAFLAVVGAEDGERASGLLATVARFNRDSLPVFAVGAPLRGAEHLSWTDLGLTTPSAHDESFALGLAALSFARLARVGAYVAVPLATTFIRPFRAGDFLADDGSPRAFLTEDGESRAAGVPAGASLHRIRTRLGIEDHRCLSAHDPVVYGADEVNAMIAAASPDGTAASLMQIAPDAPGWYASWLQLTYGPGLDWQEPVFLRLGSQGGAVEYSLRKATEA